MRAVALLILLFPACCWGQIWQQLPDFPGTARDDAAAFGIGDNIFVGTGMEVGWSLTNDWWAFNVYTQQWSSIPALPSTPRQYCTGISDGNKGYLFGGVDANGGLSELWQYDPILNQWTQFPSLPATPRYASIGASYGQKLYIVSGMLEGGSPTNEFWQFDLVTNTWGQLQDLPGTPRHRATGYSEFGSIVVRGGADSLFNALGDSWSFSPYQIGATWQSVEDLPTPRFGAAGGGDFAVIIGGATSQSNFLDEVWYDDPNTSWEALPAFPGGTRRGGISASFCCIGAWVFYGTGLDGSMTRHKDWWALEFPSSIDEQVSQPTSVHPNPGRDKFTLQLPTSGPYQLAVVDLAGRRMLDASLISPTVDASTWPPGTYLIQLTDREGQRYAARWVKLAW